MTVKARMESEVMANPARLLKARWSKRMTFRHIKRPMIRKSMTKNKSVKLNKLSADCPKPAATLLDASMVLTVIKSVNSPK